MISLVSFYIVPAGSQHRYLKFCRPLVAETHMYVTSGDKDHYTSMRFSTSSLSTLLGPPLLLSTPQVFMAWSEGGPQEVRNIPFRYWFIFKDCFMKFLPTSPVPPHSQCSVGLVCYLGASLEDTELAVISVDQFAATALCSYLTGVEPDVVFCCRRPPEGSTAQSGYLSYCNFSVSPFFVQLSY